MRAVVEAAGIKDILTKCLGTDNPINVVRATSRALAEPATRSPRWPSFGARTPDQIVGSRKMADRMLRKGSPADGRDATKPPRSSAMSTVRVTLRKSAIGYAWDQKATLAALGLRKLIRRVEPEATPGDARHDPKVRHLVAVDGEPADSRPERSAPGAGGRV